MDKRIHPWRLEIVPFLVFASGVILPWLDRSAAVVRLRGADIQRIVSPDIAWIMCYVLGSMFIADSLIEGMRRVHNKMRGEETNGYTVVLAVWPILAIALGSWIFLVRLFPPSFARPWWLFVAAATVLQAVVEWYRPRNVEPVPLRAEAIYREQQVMDIEPPKPGEPFYYREVVEKPLTWMQFLLIASFAGFITWFFTGKWWSAVWVMLVSYWGFTRSQKIFVINSEGIRAREDGRRFYVPMAKIRSCFFCDYDTRTYRDRTTQIVYEYDQVYFRKDGFSLGIETTDGKTYILGLRKPEIACRLIKAAINSQESDYRF